MEDQAIDRVHRIGQSKPVEVVRISVENTVEDRILKLQEEKRQLASSALGEGEYKMPRLTLEDLRYLFQGKRN